MTKTISKTKPFSPTAWFEVNMFPHTNRLEVVMVMGKKTYRRGINPRVYLIGSRIIAVLPFKGRS
jgi:hypothetical protein